MSLVSSEVFSRFPTLKLIISHGGGSVPYQVGRWRALMRFSETGETFDDRLQHLYFDTALYSQEAIDLLLRVCRPERCLFGTERPGAGSAIDASGRSFDDVKPLIDAVDWLDSTQKEAVFEGNARAIFRLK